MFDKITGALGGNLVEDVFHGIASEVVKRKFRRWLLIVGGVFLLVGLAGGFLTRHLMIETPEHLKATEAEFRANSSRLEDERDHYKELAETHEERADLAYEALQAEKPTKLKEIRVEVPVEVPVHVENPTDQTLVQRNAYLEGYVKELEGLVSTYEEREVKWEETVSEYRASIYDLQQSLDAAVEQTSLALEREKQWRRVHWRDAVAFGPSCSVNVWNGGWELSGGCGVSAIINVRTIVEVLR